MEKKVADNNEKIKSQDKPGFHRASGKQHGLNSKDKKISESPFARKTTKKTK